jgi:hypothetical protein
MNALASQPKIGDTVRHVRGATTPPGTVTQITIRRGRRAALVVWPSGASSFHPLFALEVLK